MDPPFSYMWEDLAEAVGTWTSYTKNVKNDGSTPPSEAVGETRGDTPGGGSELEGGYPAKEGYPPPDLRYRI